MKENKKEVKMKTMGFPISNKENEKRRALIPKDVAKIKHADKIFLEEGYGTVLGYTDKDYEACGANVTTREQTLACDIVCEPKIGDAEYLDRLKDQTVFGWVHLVQNKDIADKVIAGKMTAYAWEEMFCEGRHSFYRNNEMAGEAAIMHAFLCYGEMPYNTDVAVIGRGNAARGAIRILNCLGANITVYNRKMENLIRQEIGQYNVIVNALLWDTYRKDHIIYRDDLKRMKENSLIIDVSCDRNGAIETSVPTTLENPTYMVDGVMHYVVDHTPTLFYKPASAAISAEVCKYADELIEDKPGKVLQGALIVENGIVRDDRITG